MYKVKVMIASGASHDSFHVLSSLSILYLSFSFTLVL